MAPLTRAISLVPQWTNSNTSVVPELIASKTPSTVYQTTATQVFYYIDYSGYQPIPSPHYPIFHCWFGRKNECRCEQLGGKCRTPHGSFAADLLHGGCVPAVPFSRCKILWEGNALYQNASTRNNIASVFGSRLWAPILMTVILITKISLKVPGTRGCFASLWIVFDYWPPVINY